MLYLFWENLELHEANGLQFGLIQGLISPLTLLGWARNICRQIQGEIPDLKESASISIYSCQPLHKRTIHRSYVPGDAHLLKQRIATAFRQKMLIDLILRLDTTHEYELKETLQTPNARQVLSNMHLAKSYCFSSERTEPKLFTTEEELYNHLLSRPANGFFTTLLSENACSERASDEDPLDKIINLLSESKQYENISGISSLFPIVAGLRLLVLTPL